MVGFLLRVRIDEPTAAESKVSFDWLVSRFAGLAESCDERFHGASCLAPRQLIECIDDLRSFLTDRSWEQSDSYLRTAVELLDSGIHGLLDLEDNRFGANSEHHDVLVRDATGSWIRELHPNDPSLNRPG
jgi:hypothetical protein